MRRDRGWAAGWLGAVVAGAAACGGEAPPADPPTGTPVRVASVTVVDQPAVTTVNGAVESIQAVDLAFQVGGRAAVVVAEEGATVQAGSIVARLDTTDFQLGLELAGATAARARDEVQRVRQLAARGSVAPADLMRAETGLRQAEAQERIAARRLEDAVLRTPITGVVARRAIDPGEMIGPGIPVITVVEMHPVQVRAGVPEADIGGVRPGQAATVSVPSVTGHRFEGRVGIVGVAADPVSRTYAVTVRLPNPDRLLRPGMIAEVRIQTDRRVRAVTVPVESLVRQPDGATVVFVVRAAEGRVESRRVEVGRVLGQQVEVTSGLSGEEQVVVGGQHRLHDGDRVAVAAGGGA